ncbi:hypothetical protein VTO73DRAFT_95 [Trametes versicolor]
MRAGIVAALFLSAIFVQARPAPEQKRDIVDTVTSAAEQIFSSDIAPVLSGITPETTAIVSAFESKATQIEQDVASKNGAPAIRGSASGPLGLGLATALGSALLGAAVHAYADLLQPIPMLSNLK